ncbi:MAG: hypothetical protein NW218_13045 [Saprospiraceae bacterium]|nr:hypothetical protein [Saprospiraceae bacterium]
MEKRFSLLLALELLWWVITAGIVLIVLYPIHKAMHVWTFERMNIFFVVTLVTVTRYIFLLKHTLIAKRQVFKIVIMLAMFPLVFMLVDYLHNFMVSIENYTWDPITGHLPAAQKKSIESYLWVEMLFFGAGSIFAAPVLAVRLFMSVWRTRNYGTV